jgi:hypothetical protein
MVYDYLKTAIPIFSLAINILSQICIFRIFPKKGLLNSVFLGFFIGLFILFVFEFCIVLAQPTLTKENIAMLTVHLLTYVSLGYCYFHFINLGETARRVRILRELSVAPGGLSLEGILSHYNAKEIIELRLQRLLANGQIIAKEDKYYIGKPLMLWMAKIVVAFKFILLGKKSEFD